MNKTTVATALAFSFVVMFGLAPRAVAQSTDASFQQALMEYQQSPTAAAAEKVIKLAAAMNRLPPIPEEARKHFVRGTALFKEAKNADDFSLVLDELKQATNIAPWWPEARYNLALTDEAAGQYEDAISDLKLYQIFKLSDTDARAVQDKIYVIEAKMEKASKNADVAAKKVTEETRARAEASSPLAKYQGSWNPFNRYGVQISGGGFINVNERRGQGWNVTVDDEDAEVVEVNNDILLLRTQFTDNRGKRILNYYSISLTGDDTARVLFWQEGSGIVRREHNPTNLRRTSR
jgi:tetratricopeptide (TPR) repeat protein